MKNTQFIKGRRCKVLIAAELQKRSRAWCFGACAAVLLLVVAPKLCAQQITNIGVNEGLSSRYTFNALQDGKGFVWIATRFGIDRFDGRVARHYPIDILYKSNSPIRSVQLLLDKDSALWAFTNRGAMYKYAPQKDEFELVYYFSKYVKTACFTSTGNLFVSDRYEIGVVKNGRFTSTFNFADSNEEIKALKNYDSDNLMIATSANIYKFDIRTHKVTPILKNKLNSIESCYIDLEMQRLYIGSIVGNLYLYDMTKGILTNINDKRLQYMPILCINKIDENYIMAGTDGVGACLLNVNTLKIEDFFDDEENNALRIKGNAVYDIYNDRAGRIWLSTYSGGVNVINMQKMDFRTIEHRDNDANSLYGMSISDILEDSKGNLWFAANKGLSRYNVAQNKWTILLRNKNVLTLFQDLNGKIWAGTYSSGVFVFDLNGNLQKNLVADPANPRNSLGTNFVYSINQDSTGNIWVGGRKGSLSKYNAKNERLELLPVYQINYIVPKNKDEMLIATEQGVVTVDVASNAVRQCTFNKNLKSIFVTDIYVESDSILWLSTYGSGINRCNYYTGTVQSFSVNDGLPTSIVYAMLPDEHGNLWFSSEQGIGYFDVKKRNVQTYSKQDGISGTQYRSLSRLKDTQGNYYFGS
ncbi:MAG: hypothetical protein LBB41_08110, partial [Prevotellaceae bacterium]|nr:hypothetical protein [Prevotellaceae bacterium]